MAGASFTMDTSGLEKMLKGAISHLNDTDELMAAVGEAWVSSTKERFEDGEGPDGEPWKVSKRAEEEGGQTLVDDKILKGSISSEYSASTVAVGSNNDVYAAIHQFGGEDVDMPEIEARPFVGINEEDIEEAQFMVSEFMQEGFGI